MLQSSNPDEQSTASEQNDEQPQEKDTDFTEKVDESIETEAKVEEAVVLSPLEEAILQKESELRSTLQSLENALKSERLRLGKVKDRKSESGKLGFFMVQAQVNDFLVS